MASLSARTMVSSLATSAQRRRRCQASLHAPVDPTRKSLYIPKLPIRMEELVLREDNNAVSTSNQSAKNDMLIKKLYTIAEAVADRAEMHSIIGEQRNNWNALFLNSINSITLTATLMAGISSAATEALPLKVSSVILFAAATGMMAAVNKIQPSQLAEEQRKATTLFKQLERSIQTTLALGSISEHDVDEALERVLALEKAYPLPLLPLPDKFPKVMKPTVWWPKLKNKRQQVSNGWSKELEQEMKGVLRVIKAKDQEQYAEVGELASKINRTLAIAGPVLAGVAAIGASCPGPWAALMAVAGGSLATVVNTLEHGGQIGMVYELFRNCAGYYLRLEEEIENNLGEYDVEKREDAELFEMKMALHLGRSVSDLRGFAKYASPECKDEDIEGFAGKLF